jgi:hypothetical protein
VQMVFSTEYGQSSTPHLSDNFTRDCMGEVVYLGGEVAISVNISACRQ